jgi:hypothetical protein
MGKRQTNRARMLVRSSRYSSVSSNASLRARLQPCHKSRTRKAALAAEVRFTGDDNSEMTFRYVASAILGVVLFLFYFQPFLPYSQRAHYIPNWYPFLIIVSIGGFLLSLGLAPRHFWKIPTCLLITLFALNAILIVADTITGAADHNLFPLEFIFIVLLTLPAYLGALLAAAVDRLSARGLKA